MKDPLEPGRAVDGRRLVQTRIDPGKRRDVDDGSPSHILPHAGPHIQVPEIFRISKEVHAVHSQRVQDRIDHSHGRRKQYGNHTHDNHGGNKVRRVQHGLRHPLKSSAQLVDNQRHKDRHREPHKQRVQGQGEGIADQIPEIISVEEIRKIPEAHPPASQNTQGNLIILKRDLQAVHRRVAEDQHIDHGRQDQQIILPVFPDPVLQTDV